MKIVSVLLFYLIMNTSQLVFAQTLAKQKIDSLSVLVKNKSTIAFVGTFQTTLSACQLTNKNIRRRRLIKMFNVDYDFIGNLKQKEIEISVEASKKLINENQYLILLNPDSEKLDYFTNESIIFNFYEHIISKKEIIKITKL